MEFAEGTFAVVTATEPLPEPVRAQAEAGLPEHLMTYEAQETAGSFIDPWKATNAATSYAATLSSQTGKRIVIVYPAIGACLSDPDVFYGWSVTSVTGRDIKYYPCGIVRSLDEAKARAADLVSRTEDPSLYEVIAWE